MDDDKNLVQTVFEDFLARLKADSEVGPELEGTLRQALIEKDDHSVKKLTQALFGEDEIP